MAIRFENDLHSRAERLVLASLLLDSGCARHIDMLKPTDFSHDLHGQIFRHIVKLMAMSQPVNVVTVYESMHRRRSAPGVGVLAYLNALTQLPAVPANAGYYAASIRCAKV